MGTAIVTQLLRRQSDCITLALLMLQCSKERVAECSHPVRCQTSGFALSVTCGIPAHELLTWHACIQGCATDFGLQCLISEVAWQACDAGGSECLPHQEPSGHLVRYVESFQVCTLHISKSLPFA